VDLCAVVRRSRRWLLAHEIGDHEAHTFDMVSNREPRLAVSIRPIRRADRTLIANAVRYTSDRTYQLRFHGPRPRFSPRVLSYLTEIDGDNHFALIATERDRPDRLVAVARFVCYHDRPTEAEFAITVHDPYQGQGVGHRLLELLVQAARERGITRLRALIQSDNDPMMRLLRRVLPQARLEDRSDGECTYSADIAVAPHAQAPAPSSVTIGVSQWRSARDPRRAPACSARQARGQRAPGSRNWPRSRKRSPAGG
jgi:GNAT superfamily N-acetyltransferase